MIVVGYYHFILVVLVSILLSACLLSVHPYFHFRMITWVNDCGLTPNLVCVLILWRSCLGLLMGKFRQFLTDCLPGTHNSGGVLWFHVVYVSILLSTRLSSVHPYSFISGRLLGWKWIFTKLGMCLDILKISFRIACHQVLSIFDRQTWISNAQCICLISR